MKSCYSLQDDKKRSYNLKDDSLQDDKKRSYNLKDDSLQDDKKSSYSLQDDSLQDKGIYAVCKSMRYNFLA